MTTKILALTDSLGNLVKFRLMPEQYHDLAEVKPLIEGIDFQALLADKAFDADWLLKELDDRDAKAVIPPKANRTVQRVFDSCMYKWRHLIENYFCKLKEFKRIAMRSDKTDSSFSAMIYLCASGINSR
ncbi:transposase [Acinetobacter sp. ANC 4470]|uniref:transposase n=1 Tax=Acinetobacter sp. ANC 4470 TaxID=1977881 RepID=UPI00148AC3CE|nr:transposase [Acinetobacter sp. ANC 4470]